MPITSTDPFKGRQYPGEVILKAVRWYLRYPLSYLHVSELLTERGLFVDASCVWRCIRTVTLIGNTGITGEGESKFWLPGIDSNHDARELSCV